MHNPKKYFIEVEFIHGSSKTYWMPLFIRAENEERANKIVKALESGIKEKRIENLSISRPTHLIQGLNSKRISEYIKSRLTGRKVMIHLREWKFQGIVNEPELNFAQHTEKFILEGNLRNGEKLAINIANVKIPVSVYDSYPKMFEDDIIILEIVQPD
jgi:hypothetical protein